VAQTYAASHPLRPAPIAAALLRLASDQRLVEQARAGSEAAFDVLYRRYRGPVLAYCRTALGSAHEAEDATQQTFLAAYSALGQLNQPSALRAWLYGIARHRCQSVLRLRGGSLDRLPEPAADGVDAEIAARDDLRATLADVARLPDDQRFAIIQAELGGLSHGQIARVLGCRHDKVKALVFQARASLIANRAARETPCEEIQRQLATLRGAALRRATLRRHLANCGACTEFREQLRGRRRSPRSLLPAFVLNRGMFGPLLGGASETTLSAGTLGAGGLAATALAALALHGGDIVRAVAPARDGATVAPAARSPGATTATGPGAIPGFSPPLWRAGFTPTAPRPSRHQASTTGPAAAPERHDGRQSPADATQPTTPPAPDTTPRTDRPDHTPIASQSDKPTATGDGAPPKRGGSAPADPQPSGQAPEHADPDAPADGAKHSGADAPTGATRPATPSPQVHPPRPQPAPQADTPHPAPATPPGPSASHAAPPAAPGVANAPDHDTAPPPNAGARPTENPPGPAHPPPQAAVPAPPAPDHAPAAQPGRG
jgi:RNA polymerase sigma factor (sigma-70 family)